MTPCLTPTFSGKKITDLVLNFHTRFTYVVYLFYNIIKQGTYSYVKQFNFDPSMYYRVKSFFKSTKHANNHPSFELQYLLIRQLITNIWSAVLAFFVKPICDLCIILWSWRNLSNLKLRTLLNTLPIAPVMVIPL